MIYLLVSVGCSLAVATIFKYNEAQQWDRMALLTANYLAATLLGGVLLTLQVGTLANGLRLEPGLVGLGVVTGGLFISTFFILAWATREAGMSLATGVMRVSVILPVLVSWMVWKEIPSSTQVVGLLLATAAFFCIAYRHSSAFSSKHGQISKTGGLKASFVLLLLFLSGGIVDTSMKAFDEWYAAGSSPMSFLLLVYAVAAVIGGGIMLGRNNADKQLTRQVFLWGILLGGFNYGATLFFLYAVNQLSAPFVFPANSVSIVLGATFIGVYMWQETLSRLNWIGLGLAAIALVLLRA